MEKYPGLNIYQTPYKLPKFDSSRIREWKRFQTLLHSNGGAVIVLNENGTVCHVTTPADYLLGGRLSQMQGQYFLSLVHRRNLHTVSRCLERLVDGRRKQVSWIFRFGVKHDRWVWLKATAMCFTYKEDEKVIAMLLQDLTKL